MRFYKLVAGRNPDLLRLRLWMCDFMSVGGVVTGRIRESHRASK